MYYMHLAVQSVGTKAGKKLCSYIIVTKSQDSHHYTVMSNTEILL